jgi:hypothetical protein
VVTKPATTTKAKTTSTGGLKAIISDLKNQLGTTSFKAATTNTNIAKDIKLAAYKKGKRIVRNAGKTTNAYGTFENKVGSTYYENRANRYDANQPSTTRKYKLAKGGEISKIPIFEDGVLISKPFYFEEKSFFGLSKSYKITNQWDENVTAHFIISKNLGISKKDALDKANAFYNFCKKSKTWEQYEKLSSEFIEDWNAKKMADGGEIENSQRMQEIINRRVEISDYINKKYGQSRGGNKAEKQELEALGKEYRMLGYEYEMRKNGEFAKGGVTGDTLYIDQLASMSGASPATIKLWAIDENHLSKDDLLNIIQGLGRNQINRFHFLNAVLGDEQRTSEIIAYAKSNKGFKMADGGSLGEVKVGDYFINTTNGEKFYIEKIDKKDKSYPFYVIKSKPTDLPEVISFDEWYRYSKNGLFERVDGKFAKGGEVEKNKVGNITFFEDFSDDDVESIYGLLSSEGIEVDNSKEWYTKGYAEELQENEFERDFVVRFHISDAENPEKLIKTLKRISSKNEYIDFSTSSEFAKGGEVEKNKVGNITFFEDFSDDDVESIYGLLSSEGIEVDNSKEWYTKGYAEELQENEFERDFVVRFHISDAENPEKLIKTLKRISSKNEYIDFSTSSEFAKGGTTKTKFKVGDKVVGQFRYEYGEGLQPVSIYDYADRVNGVISNVRKIDTTTMYSIKFDNGEELQYPDFAIDNFIVKSQYAKGGQIAKDFYVVVQLRNGLITKKDFDGFSKNEIIQWCEERGWKYNSKGEKLGGQILKNYEFFVKESKRVNVGQLPSKKYAKGGTTKRIKRMGY